MIDGRSDLFAGFDALASDEPPAALIEAARADAAGRRQSHRTRVLRRALVSATALAVVAGASFTPPGRAATGWLADIAGFGDEPSLEQVGSVKGSAVVITSGALSDGTAYELVAKRVNHQSMPRVGPGPRQMAPRTERAIEKRGANDPLAGAGLVCFQVDFPELGGGGQGGHCTDGTENGDGIGAESGALYQPYGRDGGSVLDHDSAGLFVGIVEPSETRGVRVYELRPDGTRTELPSRLIEVEGEILDRIGIETPKAVVVAELDSPTVVAGTRGEIEVRAIAYGADGSEIGHDDVNFQPASCPDHPVKPPPPPPAGSAFEVGPAPHDVPDWDKPFTDICPPMLQTMGPPKFTAFQLEDAPAPPAIAAAAARQSHPIEEAHRSDYDLAHTVGANLVSVDDADQHVAGEVTRLFDASTMGDTHIYLARLAQAGDLVYVVAHEVRATQVGRDWERLAQPRRFFGIVDAVSGERIYLGEL